MMNRAVWAVMIGVMCVPFAWAQTDAERGQAFILESKRLPVAERVDRAVLTIQNSTDDAVVAEAAWDLTRFWDNPEEKIAAIDSMLASKQQDTRAFQWGTMAKARLLARQGAKEEARAIFQNAIAQNWEKARVMYFDSLWETGDYALMAMDLYEHNANAPADTRNQVVYEEGRDFIEMLNGLRAMRTGNADSSAMRDVFPKLKESKFRPLAIRFAKALCLTADDRCPEALAELDEVQKLIGEKASPDFDESRDLPLFRAAVLFFEGRDFDAARASFREYMDRNADNRSRVLGQALTLIFAMENSYQDGQIILELTDLLVNSEYITDETIKSQFPEWYVGSLLISHQSGLAKRGRWDEAARGWAQIMGEYYPRTLSSAVAALNFGIYISWRHNDLDGAERLLNDILENAPFDGIVPHVKSILSDIRAKRGDKAGAIALLQESLNRLGPTPYGKGPVSDCRKDVIRKLNELTK